MDFLESDEESPRDVQTNSQSPNNKTKDPNEQKEEKIVDVQDIDDEYIKIQNQNSINHKNSYDLDQSTITNDEGKNFSLNQEQIPHQGEQQQSKQENNEQTVIYSKEQIQIQNEQGILNDNINSQQQDFSRKRQQSTNANQNNQNLKSDELEQQEASSNNFNTCQGIEQKNDEDLTHKNNDQNDKQYVDLKNESFSLKEQNESLKQENDGLKKQIELQILKSEEQKNKNESLIQQISDLENQMNQKSKDCSNFTNRLNVEQEKYEQLQQEFRAQSDKIEQLELQIYEFKNQQQQEINLKQIEEDQKKQGIQKAEMFRNNFKSYSQQYLGFASQNQIQDNSIQLMNRINLYCMQKQHAQQGITNLNQFSITQINDDGVSYLEKQKKKLLQHYKKYQKQSSDQFIESNYHVENSNLNQIQKQSFQQINNQNEKNMQPYFHNNKINNENYKIDNNDGNHNNNQINNKEEDTIIQPDEIYVNHEQQQQTIQLQIITGFTPEEMQIKAIIDKSKYSCPPNIPFFSLPITLDEALEGENGEFKGNKRKAQEVKTLMEQNIQFVCRVRGDGNCFYRSFITNYMFLKIAASQSDKQALRNFFDAILNVQLYEFKGYEEYLGEQIKIESLLNYLKKYLKYKFEELANSTDETPLMLFMKSNYDSSFDLILQLITRSLMVYCFEINKELQQLQNLDNLKENVLKINTEGGDELQYFGIASLFNSDVSIFHIEKADGKQWENYSKSPIYFDELSPFYLSHSENPMMFTIYLWYKTGHYYFFLNQNQYNTIQQCQNKQYQQQFQNISNNQSEQIMNNQGFMIQGNGYHQENEGYSYPQPQNDQYHQNFNYYQGTGVNDQSNQNIQNNNNFNQNYNQNLYNQNVQQNYFNNNFNQLNQNQQQNDYQNNNNTYYNDNNQNQINNQNQFQYFTQNQNINNSNNRQNSNQFYFNNTGNNNNNINNQYYNNNSNTLNQQNEINQNQMFQQQQYQQINQSNSQQKFQFDYQSNKQQGQKSFDYNNQFNNQQQLQQTQLNENQFQYFQENNTQIVQGGEQRMNQPLHNGQNQQQFQFYQNQNQHNNPQQQQFQFHQQGQQQFGMVNPFPIPQQQRNSYSLNTQDEQQQVNNMKNIFSQQQFNFKQNN